jgi:type I restriction enzyme S subunit
VDIELLPLGDLPSGWSTFPVWKVFRRNKRTGFPDKELLSVYRDHGVIPKSSRTDNHNIESEDLGGYQLVQPGDLVVNKMKAWQGSVAVSNFEGIVSPAYFVYQMIGQGHAPYFHFLLRSAPYISAYNKISKGVRVGQWDLQPQEFRKLPLVVPPIEAQIRIAKYLEERIATAAPLVEAQQALLKGLDKRASAVIRTHIFGEQVSSDEGGMPSGLATGRLIPDFTVSRPGWSTVPVRRLFKFQKEEVGDTWSTTQLLSLTTRGVISRDIDSGIGKYPESFEGYQKVKPGDLVFCLFDVEETPRTVGLVREEGMITSAYTRVILDKDLAFGPFVEYLFIALDDEKRFKPFYRGLRNTIPAEVLRGTLLSLPSLAEQKKIVQSIDAELREISKLQEKVSALSGLVRERNSSLISEVVTGKRLV